MHASKNPVDSGRSAYSAARHHAFITPVRIVTARPATPHADQICQAAFSRSVAPPAETLLPGRYLPTCAMPPLLPSYTVTQRARRYV
jgi:hypothetical protein